MGQKRRGWLSALLVTFALLSDVDRDAYASNTRIERDNLHGVKPIYIMISPLPKWAEDNGVTRQMMREWVESEFKSHKIRLSDTVQDTGGAFSIIIDGKQINNTVPPHAVVAYQYINCVTLLQNVRLLYDKRISIATTWSDWNGGVYTDAKGGATSLFDDVKEATKIFIADYLSANPE